MTPFAAGYLCALLTLAALAMVRRAARRYAGRHQSHHGAGWVRLW